MSSLYNLCDELKSVLNMNKVTRILLPMDVLIILGFGAALVLNLFLGLGPLVSFVSFYGIHLGILMAFANRNYLFTYGGLFIYTGVQIVDVVINGVFRSYRFFDTYSLLCALAYGFLGYLVYSKVEADKRVKPVQDESQGIV